jgi:integrase
MPHARASTCVVGSRRTCTGVVSTRLWSTLRRGPVSVTRDLHVGSWFRQQIWEPALADAGLGFHVRVHDLRHAHASWLLARGADLQSVKDRMGHARLTTTEQYLHSLPHANAAAIAALDHIRKRT